MISTYIREFTQSDVLVNLGWALVHFAWQGMIIAFVIWIALAFLSREKSSSRYWVSCMGLLAMTLAPLLTFLWLQNSESANRDIRLAAADVVTDEAMLLDVSQSDSVTSLKQTASLKHLGDVKPINARLPKASKSVSVEIEPIGLTDRWVSATKAKIADLAPWFVLSWVIGVTFLTFRLAWGCLSIRRLTRTARELGSESKKLKLEKLQAALGMSSQRVALKVSSMIDSPVVFGWLKPMILLPPSALTGLSTSELSAILTHELAHLKRNDFVVNSIQVVMETILFYHPAVWWVSAQIRNEREHCCDDLACSVVASENAYARALIRLEESRESSQPAVNLGFRATGGVLFRRIQRLTSRNAYSKQPPFRLATALMLTIGLSITISIVLHSGLAVGQQVQDDEEPIKRVDSIAVTMLDPQGSPVQGIKIHAGVWSGSGYKSDVVFPPNQVYFTDKEGRAKVALPTDYYIVRLFISSDKFAPMFVGWEETMIMSNEGPPAEITFSMVAGVEIGGKVIDESGDPIANAKVSIRGSGVNLGSKKARMSGNWQATTDKDGFWTVENGIPGDKVTYSVTCTHEDFIPSARQTLAPTKDFFEKRVASVLKRGVSVEGIVVGPNDAQIDSGLIVWGDHPYMERGSQEQRLDEKGAFKLPPLPAGKTRLTAIVPGYAPAMQFVEISKDVQPVHIKLEDGHKVQIKIVDSDGQPIPEAYAQVNRWRGAESIYAHDHPNVKPTGIPVRANEEGVFTWGWAPGDPVTYTISARDFIVKRNIKIGPTPEPTVVTLNRLLEVKGLVVDSETGEPIKHVSVIPLVHLRPDTMPDRGHERRDKSVFGNSNGQFSILLDRDDCSYRLKFEAEGYQPFRSSLFKLGDKLELMKVKLSAGKTDVHRVLDKAGNPVANAKVYIASTLNEVRLRNFQGQPDERSYSTNDKGEFSILEFAEPYTVIVVSEKGYSETLVDPAKLPESIAIDAYGSHKGAFMLDGQPVKNATIMYSPINYSPGRMAFDQGFKTKTDPQGRFDFNRVPIGNGKLQFLVKGLDVQTYERYELPVQTTPKNDADTEKDVVFEPKHLVKAQFSIDCDPPVNVNWKKSFLVLDKVKRTLDLPPMLASKNLDLTDRVAAQKKLRAAKDFGAIWAIRNSYESYWDGISENGAYEQKLFNPGEYKPLLTIEVETDGKPKYFHAVLPKEFETISITNIPLDLGKIVIKQLKPMERE